MDYKIIVLTNFLQNCLIIWCKNTYDCALVDPGGDTNKLKKQLLDIELKPNKILLTHGHIDHVAGAAELASFYKIPIIGPHIQDLYLLNNLPNQSKMFHFPKCEPLRPDYFLEENNIINIGNIRLEVIHCPGHTPGHIVFFNRKNKLLIAGDTLFKGSIGRTDFLQGNYQQLVTVIKQKILSLGDEVILIPGHGPISTVGKERITNPFLK
ncbi:MBL fold metallo-hydrolase [Candidatus Ishikawella capsulata]|uniref:Predicted metal-binding enzyme n=1 Tax=Candidatus Ishikawaella capsulata Mpkobe TaxID=476281 RepID=C5WDM1_9ENTR|nr:MBL fold metallo-hydrolase [Candidatus Ishikawaella capsulata]BAH83427.1 predicted metal-binding enzyme [Candidatus Ishikawaella capsulata Mpkobe]